MSRLVTLLRGRFSPTIYSGLKVWLDASQRGSIVLNGSTVSHWKDLSGNGNDAVQTTAIDQPLYVANAIGGRPALQGYHDGANRSIMRITDNSSLDYGNYTIFAVFKRVGNLAAEETLISKYDTTPEFRIGVNASVDSLFHLTQNSGVTGNLNSAQTVGTGTPAIVTSRYVNATSISLRINRNTAVTASCTGVANAGSPLELFGRSLSLGYAGHIAEMLFYTANLSDAAETRIHTYLAGKWGMSI